LSLQASLNNQESMESWRFWRKYNRGTIVENMSRFGAQYEVYSTLVKRVTMANLWHDFRNPNLESLLPKTESCHNFIKSCHDFRSSCCLFKLNCFKNKGYESWREKVRFADLDTEERGDFLHSLPVYVCFNSFIEYAICKLKLKYE